MNARNTPRAACPALTWARRVGSNVPKNADRPELNSAPRSTTRARSPSPTHHRPAGAG